MTGKALCVFCSSSDAVERDYLEAARAFGERLARGGHSLVYGGTNLGLMGAVATAVQRGGGRVVGVVPRVFLDRGIAWEGADELVVTEDMRDRKASMEARADAFVALPGGFGTLEEILEILVRRQLGLHAKAIAFLNTHGFYDSLLAVFEQLYRQRFAKGVYRRLYFGSADPAAVLDYVERFAPEPLAMKWFEPDE